MNDAKYVARTSGAVGYDILDPEGEVVASAADGWEPRSSSSCSTTTRSKPCLSAVAPWSRRKPVRPRLDRHERKSPGVGRQTRRG